MKNFLDYGKMMYCAGGFIAFAFYCFLFSFTTMEYIKYLPNLRWVALGFFAVAIVYFYLAYQAYKNGYNEKS